MRDQDKRQQNKEDLDEIRALIDDADGTDYSLESILAEFGSKKPKVAPIHSLPISKKQETLQEKAASGKPSSQTREAEQNGKAVAFSGEEGLKKEPEEGPPDLDPGPLSGAVGEEDTQQGSEEDGAEILTFPERESILSALLHKLGHRADDYAEQMFSQEEMLSSQETRRAEELIPGTDWEEEDVRYVRPRRREDPTPEDLPPQELARRYGQGLAGLRLRAMGVFFAALAGLALMLAPQVGLSFPQPLDEYPVQVWALTGLLGFGMLLGIDVLAGGLGRMFRLRLGMDSLTALACIATLCDGAMLAINQNRERMLPYSVVALFGLFCQMHGAYHKRCGLRLSCRTAAASKEPYLVTLDEGKWSGRDTYVKWAGIPQGFGSQIQMDDGAQRVYRRYCPILLVGCVCLSLLASQGAERAEHLVWCFSATLTATAAFGGGLVYGRAFHKLERRLAQSGGALAGWPGIARSRRGSRVLLTDLDLFPLGYVEFNGIKVFGEVPLERVVSYTATLIRDSGSGLNALFHGLLRAQGAVYRRAEDLACYEVGGLSASIRGAQVLVGSAAFMNLMEIPLPEGLNVKQAVFCAVDGELAGIFALHYVLPDTVFPSVEALLREKVGPVLATRDFNLIPAMLQQRFKLAADRMDFPPIERRRELSEENQSHSETLTAVLCREGLAPFADVVVGAKRLRSTVRVGSVICCIGATLGLLLSAYLTAVAAFYSLSPENLLLFMAAWLAPVWFLTDLPHRY